MILTGNEDLRVKKTITGIKTAFEALICEKEYDRITVKELCDRAQVNKKTFYHYYETLDALLNESQMELSSAYLERMDAVRPRNVATGREEIVDSCNGRFAHHPSRRAADRYLLFLFF